MLIVASDQNNLNRNTTMPGTSLNRTAIERTNKSDASARPTSNERIGGLRTRKTILGRLACKGLLVATIWLLLTPGHGLSQSSAPLINLLDPKKGGQVIEATKDAWLNTIKGKEDSYFEFDWDEWAIYAFRDERPAIFDTFAVLIPGKGNNMKDFELLAGNDSPTGNFESLGTFTTANAKLMKSPYQEFKFPPVTAKYLKVQLQSGWEDHRGARVFQFRLFGRLKE
jgi:hypothetical protein